MHSADEDLFLTSVLISPPPPSSSPPKTRCQLDNLLENITVVQYGTRYPLGVENQIFTCHWKG